MGNLLAIYRQPTATGKANIFTSSRNFLATLGWFHDKENEREKLCYRSK